MPPLPPHAATSTATAVGFFFSLDVVLWMLFHVSPLLVLPLLLLRMLYSLCHLSAHALGWPCRFVEVSVERIGEGVLSHNFTFLRYVRRACRVILVPTRVRVARTRTRINGAVLSLCF